MESITLSIALSSAKLFELALLTALAANLLVQLAMAQAVALFQQPFEEF